MMIINHIIGGIGNQMFQYAAGRALSLTHGHELLVDLSSFPDYSLHNGYELNKVFNVNVKSTNEKTVSQLLRWRSISLIMMVLRRPQFSGLRGKSFIVEPYFSYWAEFFDVTHDCYLYGYWQSESYFQKFERTIRKDFTFREPLDAINSCLAAEIASTPSVSLHVRRGDYVTDSKNHKIMNVCSLSYYHKAIEYISQRVDNPIFYVFSDDIAWVKRELLINFECVFVNHNQQLESYRDMQLMSLCKHNIIANSSFSWWAAWLNESIGKLVVTPKYWFRNGNDDSDLIPDEWIRL